MTKTEDIKRLLARYYDGQTTEEEESTLRSYFNSDAIDDCLKDESAIFTALQSAECPLPEGLEARLNRQINQWNTVETTAHRTVRLSNLRWIVGIAACLLLLFAAGAVVYQSENRDRLTEQDTYTDTKDAYAETSRALLKFSNSINKGIETAENITNKTGD